MPRRTKAQSIVQLRIGLYAVIDADSIWHGGTCHRALPPLLQMAGHGGAPYVKKTANQTVLTITKALTKTTNCTCEAKKCGGAQQNFFSGASHRTCATTFKFVPAPLYAVDRKHKMPIQFSIYVANVNEKLQIDRNQELK